MSTAKRQNMDGYFFLLSRCSLASFGQVLSGYWQTSDGQSLLCRSPVQVRSFGFLIFFWFCSTYHVHFLIHTLHMFEFCRQNHTYSRLRNKHRGTLINFLTFFQGLHSLLDRVMLFFKISAILWYGECVFQGLRLISLPNVPWAMFIPGATSIPESRVV